MKIQTKLVIVLSIVTAATLFITENQKTQSLSSESVRNLEEISNLYGIASAEVLIGNDTIPFQIDSTLSANLLKVGSVKDSRGIILKLENSDEGQVILMTPSNNMNNVELEKIADLYEKIIPEVAYAEPDYAIELLSDEEPTIINSYLDITLPYASIFNVSPSFETLRKENKNHNLRGRLPVSKKSPLPYIAVLDSGLDTSHPYLEEFVWENEKEKINGLDDDENGFTDDIYGWDFINDQGLDLKDDIGHGTHIAGILAKQFKDSGETTKLVPLKVFDKKGESKLSYAIRAIKYATDNNLKLMNVSFGTTTDSKALADLCEYAYSKGSYIVSASGNRGSNIRHYPAGNEKVIAVGALAKDGKRLEESNYGAWVDVYAPGEKVTSTIPNKMFGYLSGTSQSAPFVTASVAKIIQNEPVIEIDELVKQLKKIDFATMSGPSKN